MAAKIIEAVTATFTCGDECYLVQRQASLPAFPGYVAFPGGKVDKADHAASGDVSFASAVPARFIHALCRELQEELGLDLRALVAAGQVERVDCLGSALTPDFMPVRFDTRCFRITVRSKPPIDLDLREHAIGEWLTYGQAWERYQQGRLCVAPPTMVVLRALAQDASVQEVPDLAFNFDAERYAPWVEMLKGVVQIMVRSHTLPPADRTNAFLIGDTAATRFLVDPAPRDKAELRRLLNVVEPMGVAGIFLTHHHPDHREYADEIARLYRIPIHLSADTQERIQAKTRGKFFRDVEVCIRREGEVLTTWLGEPVQILEVPGHDEGQLALMPASRSWCIVSDLIQSVGTVVVAKPEGDMRKYFASLQRVIDLDPKVIYPSHGPGLGGTYRLSETLEHRRKREAQVLALHQSGKRPLQMLPTIYGLIDPRLMPLALCNIESHLDKLRAEGRI